MEITDFLTFLLPLVAFILALTIHEFSHAAAADLLGDNTARRLGRLTLNPLAHIDPIGLILLILVRFGWAKPVPFNPRNFRYPRFFSVLVGFAGPASNFVLAVLSTLALHHLPLNGLAIEFFQVMIWINVMLGIFNLLPIPPLDGSHLIRALMPTSLLPYYQQFERVSFFLLIILVGFVPPFREFLMYLISRTVFLLDIYL